MNIMIAAEAIREVPSQNAATTATANGTTYENGAAARVPSNNEDEYFRLVRTEALRVLQDEPEMERYLRLTVLAPHVASFEDAVIQTLCHRLLLPAATPLHSNNNTCDGDEAEESDNRYSMSPKGLRKLVHLCMESDMTEKGWTFAEAIRKDAAAVVERDPAMESILEVVLFAKG